MGGASNISTAITAVMGAATQVMQSRAQQKAYERSAKANELEAEYARKKAAWEAERIRKAGERLRSRQRAALASQGIDPNSGSSLYLLADTAGEIELDALLAEYEGSLEAWRFGIKADEDRAAGRFARYAGYSSAANKIITGASKFDWKALNSSGGSTSSGMASYNKSLDWDTLGTLR